MVHSFFITVVSAADSLWNPLCMHFMHWVYRPCKRFSPCRHQDSAWTCSRPTLPGTPFIYIIVACFVEMFLNSQSCARLLGPCVTGLEPLWVAYLPSDPCFASKSLPTPTNELLSRFLFIFSSNSILPCVINLSRAPFPIYNTSQSAFPCLFFPCFIKNR